MATGNGDGKDNDKSTLSQAGEGANTKEEGDEEEALDEDPGARPRIRQLGEAEGRGGKGVLNKFYWNSSWCSTGWQSIRQSDSAARIKFEMQ